MALQRYDQGSIGMRREDDGAWCEYEEAQNEIKQLTMAISNVLEAADVVLEERDAARAEVERLQTLLCRMNADMGEIDRLRDQVTRLSTLVDVERQLHDTKIEQLRDSLEVERKNVAKYRDACSTQAVEINQLIYKINQIYEDLDDPGHS